MNFLRHAASLPVCVKTGKTHRNFLKYFIIIQPSLNENNNNLAYYWVCFCSTKSLINTELLTSFR